MAVDFSALLSKPIESAEKPKLLPIGTYTGRITKMPEFGTTKSEKQTPYCRLTIGNLFPEADVVAEDFEAFGGQAKLSGADGGTARTLEYDFFLTPDSLYRLREFMEQQLKINTTGRTFEQAIPDMMNQDVRVHVAHRAGQGTRSNEFFPYVDEILAAA